MNIFNCLILLSSIVANEMDSDMCAVDNKETCNLAEEVGFTIIRDQGIQVNVGMELVKNSKLMITDALEEMKMAREYYDLALIDNGQAYKTYLARSVKKIAKSLLKLASSLQVAGGIKQLVDSEELNVSEISQLQSEYFNAIGGYNKCRELVKEIKKIEIVMKSAELEAILNKYMKNTLDLSNKSRQLINKLFVLVMKQHQ